MINGKSQTTYPLEQTGLNLGPTLSVVKTSFGLGWPDLNISLITGTPYDSPLMHDPIPDLWLAMPIDPTRVGLVIDGRVRDLVMPANRICMIAPETPFGTIRRDHSRVLHVFIKRRLVVEVAGEMFDRDVRSIDFAPQFNIDDCSIALLMSAVEQVLFERSVHTDLMVAHLARALVAHILSTHYDMANNSLAKQVPLSVKQTKILVDYINNHLSDKISLDDLASLVHLGVTSLLKRFKASFRQTPHQYLISTRLNHARSLLEQSTLPVAEIAMLCGFADQTHLCVVFKRMVGMTPVRYRQLMTPGGRQTSSAAGVDTGTVVPN